MSDDSQSILESLFPVGQERWVKVKYLDLDKAIKAFRLNNGNMAKGHEEELGYEVTAIGIRDEYTPQVSALMDIKEDIIGAITSLGYNLGPENQWMAERLHETINGMLKNKIEELKERTIHTG